MKMMDESEIVILLALVLVPILIYIFYILTIWWQASTVGCAISPIRLLMMLFRKVSPKSIVSAGIALHLGGVDIHWDELEAHYMAIEFGGVGDLNNTVQVLLKAKEQDMQIDYAQVCGWDLSGYLLAGAIEEAVAQKIKVSELNEFMKNRAVENR